MFSRRTTLGRFLSTYWRVRIAECQAGVCLLLPGALLGGGAPVQLGPAPATAPRRNQARLGYHRAR
eukprot:11195422-Lingulodinium_polyedra.AAC.1